MYILLRGIYKDLKEVMIKLLKYLRKQDWVFLALIIGLTVFQVWCTMCMTDYIRDIIQSIMYNDYHAHPENLGEEVYGLYNGLGQWDGIKALGLTGLTGMLMTAGASEAQAGQAAAMILSVADASVGDIWWNAGMMILFAALSMLAQGIIAVFAAGISANISRTLRSEMNKKIAYMSLAEINHFSTASLITRTTNDVQQYQFTIILLLRMVFSAPVTAIWAICKIQVVSGELTLIPAIGIVLLVLGLILLMIFVLPKFKIIQKLLDRVNGITKENLEGIRVVRAYNAEDYQDNKFQEANRKLTKDQLYAGRMLSLINPLITIIMNGITLGIYWLGSVLINQGTTDYATVTSFMTLSSQIIMSFMMLMMMFVMWPRANVSAQRILEVLNANNSITDPVEEKPLKEKGTVEFKDVTFAYPDSENPVIEHVSFKAKKGQTVAFIGSTGSGKSTVISLVNRLYDSTSGEVMIDGTDIKDIKQEHLRHLIGYVPQKALLFSGTIHSNIAFRNPDLSEEEMKKAARVSCSEEFIEKMDDKYESHIAQGGTNVSGGQRQRLCIARAIATNPEILIFDDSFSALDFKTDKTVRENLAKEYKDTTKLIVATRIGTIMDADLIVVLSEGKVVGEGTHKELLQNCDVYRDIALSQLTKEELGL